MYIFQTDKMRLLDLGGMFLRHPPVFLHKTYIEG